MVDDTAALENTQEYAATGAAGENAPAGSGANSLAGYDYQVDVSVWLALDLLLANRFARSLELEPSSEEDVEAELGEREPGRVATSLSVHGYRLVVQAKRRGGDAWTVAGINALLKHGGRKRISAARRLAESDVRYLLVTSAALNGGTRGLAVGRPGNWPQPAAMPASTRKALPEGAAGRVGIVGNLDEDKLVGEIKRLLIERFGVPFSRWIACLGRLREEARLRVTRKVGDGIWRREDLAYLIREHDGYLAASPQLENYVFPKNWKTLCAAMDGPRYAAVIIGQSGTGKTSATDKLHEVLRAQIPGLTRVPIRHGPQELRDDRTPPPVLYDIEDPWGRFDFDPASRPWNDQLGHFLAHAGPNRRIVVTTRRDVGVASKALGTVEDWLVPLEVEHYGPEERRQLYRSRIGTLPRDVQVLAASAQGQVLDELALPLEIEKFFDALRASGRDDPHGPTDPVSAAIRRAHRESIELTVVEQIRQRGDIAAAAVIWALLKANDRLSLRVVRRLDMELADRHRRFERGITPLVDFFAAARNLSVGQSDATYYHPRVEAGIEKALEQDPVSASLALRALVDTLADPAMADQEVVTDRDWGAGVAARILAAVGKVPGLTLAPRPALQAVLDAWIDSRCSDPDTRMDAHMRLAASVGSDASTAAQFARYLRHRPDSSFGSIMTWAAPGHPQSWYERMRDAPAMRIIAARFVRELLPQDRTTYGAAFVDDLARMAPDLAPAYLEATAGVIGCGFDPVVATLAEGAVRDLAGFEAVLDAAVASLASSEAGLSKKRSEGLAFLNGVYSDEYAEHVAGDDDTYAARTLVEAYVGALRRRGNWQGIARHRHAAALRGVWMQEIAGEAHHGTAPAADELAGVWAAIEGTESEHRFWYALRLCWDPVYLEPLTARIRSGANDTDVRTAALECLLVHCPDRFPQLLEEAIGAHDTGRAAEMAIDLGLVVQRYEGNNDTLFAAASLALARIDSAYAAIAAAARALHHNGVEPIPLPPHAADLMARTPGDSKDIRRLRIQQYQALGRGAAPDIERTLAEAQVSWEDDIACKEAIEAAIALGLDPIVKAGLEHMFTSVIVPSLMTIGEPLPAPLPERLLALARARGRPVREALLALLEAKPHPAHLPTMMALVHDEWSDTYRSHEENDVFPIAQHAVSALHVLPVLPLNALEELDAVAIATTDHNLRLAIFELLALRGRIPFQQRLLERACAPGRSAVRRSAAHALLVQADELGALILDLITPEVTATRIAGVASRLVLTLVLAGSEGAVLAMGRVLAANPKRRVLVLLAFWAARVRRPGLSQSLARLLPGNHRALVWLEASVQSRAEAHDELISDLGEPTICTEVLGWLNSPNQET